MTDNEIKTLLNEYVDAEMSLIDMDKYKKYPFQSSDRYKKRIKKLFSIEKYFGKNIRLGYIVKRVAIFVICLIGLVAVTEVSARILGVEPWKYITTYFADEGSEQKVYQNSVKPSDNIKLKEAKNDIPLYIPEGLVQQKNGEKTDFSRSETWFSKNQTKGVAYNRLVISDTMVTKNDAEYTKKEVCNVGGYKAYYYHKNDENWITWDDKKYNYMIQIVGYSDAKKELLKIAKSIYE